MQLYSILLLLRVVLDCVEVDLLPHELLKVQHGLHLSYSSIHRNNLPQVNYPLQAKSLYFCRLFSSRFLHFGSEISPAGNHLPNFVFCQGVYFFLSFPSVKYYSQPSIRISSLRVTNNLLILVFR